MAKDIKNLTCWVVSEGIAGTENQCIGVAEALDLDPVVKRIQLNFPWNKFSPKLRFEIEATFTPKLAAPWPDLVIASGRKAVAAARYIKMKSGGKSFTVFLQNPRVNTHEFDLVAIPFHDEIKGENVIITDGAPNRITEDKLKLAKEEFKPIFKGLKEPRAAVLIGGNSNSYKLTPETTEKLCEQLNNLPLSLMVTTSRRTPDECKKIIQKQLDTPNNLIWDGKSKNPYFGILSWADTIFVTEESTSMISDAGTTGKPTYIIPMEGHSKKFGIFHDHLKKLGVIKTFDGKLEEWDYAPLQDTQNIANAIIEKLQKQA